MPHIPANEWPPLRRLAWILLFWAIFGWATMVDPRPGVTQEPLPLAGYLGV